MRFTPDNFLYLLKQLVSGQNADATPGSGTASAADGGIKVDIDLGLNYVTNATATVTLAETGMSVLQTAAAGTTIGHVSFPIPRDYDEASDTLRIQLSVQLVNADAGITMTGTPFIKQPGKAAAIGAVSTATLPFFTAAVNLSQTEQFVEIMFKGYGLVRNAVIDVQLAYAGTLSGAANIYGLSIGYDSTIVSYNETDATEDPTAIGANVIGFGNPLR